MTNYWLRHKGTLFPVHQSDCLLGRSHECLIVLASERVSREHAVVRRIHTGLEIEDLGSRNGTWVNGSRIRRPTVLQPGDEVQLGEDLLEVVIQSNAQPPVTVSGVVSPIGEEGDRQRRMLEQVEYAMARLDPGDDQRAAANRFRSAVDELMLRQSEQGVVLSPEEIRRLARVARMLASWADSRPFERWSHEITAQLSQRLPPVSEGPSSSR